MRKVQTLSPTAGAGIERDTPVREAVSRENAGEADVPGGVHDGRSKT